PADPLQPRPNLSHYVSTKVNTHNDFTTRRHVHISNVLFPVAETALVRHKQVKQT
ncbi:hypothetical protein M407DRAFT_129660, partial [Tulasnella calospora MUT 4182]